MNNFHFNVIEMRKRVFICPNCGYEIYPCDFSGCENDAEFEGWYGSGLIRKMKVCLEHAPRMRGWGKMQKEMGQE